MDRTKVWEDEIEEICWQLTPPLLFASIDSWYYPQGDSEEHRLEASRRITAARRWVNQDVPSLLERLHSCILEKGQESRNSVSLEVKSSIVIATAVYISPRREQEAENFEGNSSSNSREPWITGANTKLAKTILCHPIVSLEPLQLPGPVCLDTALVSYLLEVYIKPLFQSTPSRKINASTGRATKVDRNISDSAGLSSSAALMEDEIVWKGGDVEHAANMKILGSDLLFEVKSQPSFLQRRHRALGSSSVLYICFLSIHAFHITGSSSWDHFWPLVLPPVLTLLEDSSPLYRLLGSQILNTTLFCNNEKGALVGSLLLRTGVAALLRQTLESSLTFISAKLSAPLLQSAAKSLILLSQITTTDLRSNPSMSLNVNKDGGRERFAQLSKVVDDGVLRVWAYAPASVSALDSEEVIMHTDKAIGIRVDGQEKEANDVVNASIDVLTRLTQPDALGLCIARYLDVTLDFLTTQLIGLESKLERRKEAKKDIVSLEREICSARAIESLLLVCRRAPGLRTWSSRCLDGVVRCWTVLQERQKNTQVQVLFVHLDGIIKALVEAQPGLLQQQLQKLLDLDEEIFSPLVSNKLTMKK